MRGEVAHEISAPEARYLALVAQRLEPDPSSRAGAGDLLDTVHRISTLQLDSINVVARAHETALWSRHGAFDRAELAALHHPDRRLVEYWAHAASLLPVAFLPYLRRNMEHYRDPARSRWARWAAANQELLDHVIETIRSEGPLSTRAFARPDGKDRQRWEWFGGKPAKQALDFLWTRGDLVIHRRVGFEREYELTERAFPDLHAGPLPPLDEEQRFFTLRALRALGVGTVPWLADYFHGASGRYVSATETTAALRILSDEGQALPVRIVGLDGSEQQTPAWLDPALVPALEHCRAGAVRPVARTLLTPFDNLLWRRNRARALFGFDYRIESYTREEHRVYGYHTLPILIDGEIVGRLDPRHRRREGRLDLVSVHLEPGIRPSAALADAIAHPVRALAAFIGADAVTVGEAYPPLLRRMLARRLG